MSEIVLPADFQTLSKQEKIERLRRMGKSPQEIRQITNISRSYIFKKVPEIDQKIAAEKEGVEGSSEIKATQVEKEATEIPVIEESRPEDEKPLSPEARKALEIAEKGAFDPSDIEGLFSAINSIFPKHLQRDDRAMGLLGKLGAKPINRLMGTYADKNLDLYLFLGAVAIVFAPAIYGLIMEVQKRKKEEKPIAEGTGHQTALA